MDMFIWPYSKSKRANNETKTQPWNRKWHAAKRSTSKFWIEIRLNEAFKDAPDAYIRIDPHKGEVLYHDPRHIFDWKPV